MAGGAEAGRIDSRETDPTPRALLVKAAVDALVACLPARSRAVARTRTARSTAEVIRILLEEVDVGSDEPPERVEDARQKARRALVALAPTARRGRD